MNGRTKWNVRKYKLKTYEINVEFKLGDPKIKGEIKHPYKFESKTDRLDHDGLLLPKHELSDAQATSKIKECSLQVSGN